MYSIRIQLFCLLFSVSAIGYATVTDTTTIQTQQNLDNEFYIKDDGTVGTQSSQNVESFSNPTTSTISVLDTIIPVREQSQVIFFSKERKSEVAKDMSTPISARPTEQKSSTDTSASSSLAIPIPIEVTHVPISVLQEVKEESLPITEADPIVKDDKLPIRDLVEETSVETETVEKDYEGYVPVHKRKSSYRNLEEATLASDRLLAQLKKKQPQKGQSVSKSESLSSRVMKGGDHVRNTAKKSGSVDNSGGKNLVNDKFDYDTDFGNEPTYYINGVRVEKSDVLKLRKRNILSRTMKLADTASRNPNGEIWFEVRE